MADIKRLNYFNYQFLKENDFTEEQDYHVSMRRKHNKALHSWGIAEGLVVTRTGEKEVTISKGTAIDNNGWEIVLLDPVTVDLTSSGPNAKIYLTIAYHEIHLEDDHYTSGGVDNFTRTTERPKTEDKTTEPPRDGSEITLALIELDGAGNVDNIEKSVRKSVGSKIATGTVGPNELAQNAVTSAKLKEADDTTGQDANTGSGIKTAHIQNGAVSEEKLAINAVTSAKLKEADDGTTGQDANTGSGIKTAHIQNGAVSEEKVAINAITSAKLKEADDGTTGQDANTGSGVKKAHIQNGAVSEEKVAINAITSAKINEADGKSEQDVNSGSGIKTGHIQDKAVSKDKLDDALQTTVKNAVQNTGGRITGKLDITGKLTSETSVTGSDYTYGVHGIGNSSGTGTVVGTSGNSGGTGKGRKIGIWGNATAAAGDKTGGLFSAETTGTEGSESTMGVDAIAKSGGSGPVLGAKTSAGGSGAGDKYGISAKADADKGIKYGGEFYANTSGEGEEGTYGIWAKSFSKGSGPVYGLKMESGGSGSGAKNGIYCKIATAAGAKIGAQFDIEHSGKGEEQTTGVFANARSSGKGLAAGVIGSATGSGKGTVYGVYGLATGSEKATKYAGMFSGNVHITGSLSKLAGSFLIDHVLDPENKTLRHGFVESPEDLCLYRGKVKLDAEGRADVKMPNYFAALTKEEEATVNLTAVGKQPFMVSYEWNKKNTAFTVYGEANREVTYIVLADRDDPAIRHFRKPVEEAKGNGNFEKGKYICPEAYGEQPEVDLDVEKMEKERLKEEKERSKEDEKTRTVLRRTIKEGEKALAALDEEAAKEHRKLIARSGLKIKSPRRPSKKKKDKK